MFRSIQGLFRTIIFAAFLFHAPALIAVVVTPISSSPYPVGCTNFQVSGSTYSTADMERYLIGSYNSTGDTYITDILQYPSDCPSIDVTFPNDSSLFGRHAGTSVRYVFYVFYPTTDDNSRPSYVFPYTNTDDHVFTHMQRPGEAPLLRDPRVRYPLIIYSTGYNAHGLWDLSHMKLLASQGYIVAAIQHGDGRNSFQGCMGERPLAVSRLIDYLLAHPVFGPAIDTARIGISGTSLGGYTTRAVAGGGYNNSPLVPPDKRIHAAFGLVPLVGGNYGVRPFGGDYSALNGVTCPFFAIYAENDTSVPKTTVEGALPKIAGTCAGVLFPGETHSLTNGAYAEAQTYEILFFRAWLRDDKEAATTLYGDMSVRGGPTERRTYLHIATTASIDEGAAYGRCPATDRLGVRVLGNKIRVIFPVSTDGSIRYDLMGSPDLGNWQCLSVTDATPVEGEVPAVTLPDGFRWRVVEVPGSAGDLTTPLFMRVRLGK